MERENLTFSKSAFTESGYFRTHYVVVDDNGVLSVTPDVKRGHCIVRAIPHEEMVNNLIVSMFGKNPKYSPSKERLVKDGKLYITGKEYRSFLLVFKALRKRALGSDVSVYEAKNDIIVRRRKKC